MSPTLHFPSRETIVTYLEKHPLTGGDNGNYLKENGIIEGVAKAFANQDKAPMGVDMGVMLTMHDLNEKIKLPSVAIMKINMNLSAALKDCANGNQLKLEKKG